MSELIQKKKSLPEGAGPSKAKRKPGQKGSELELQNLRSILQKLKGEGKLIPPEIEMQVREKFGFSEADKVINENRREASRKDIKNYVDKGKEVPKYILHIAKSVLDETEIDALLNGKVTNEETVGNDEPQKTDNLKKEDGHFDVEKKDENNIESKGKTSNKSKPKVKVKQNNIKKKKKKPGWFSKFKLMPAKIVKKLKKVKMRFSLKVDFGSKDKSFLGIKGLGISGDIGLDYDSGNEGKKKSPEETNEGDDKEKNSEKEGKNENSGKENDSDKEIEEELKKLEEEVKEEEKGAKTPNSKTADIEKIENKSNKTQDDQKNISVADIKKYTDKGKKVPAYVLNIAKKVLTQAELDGLLNTKEVTEKVVGDKIGKITKKEHKSSDDEKAIAIADIKVYTNKGKKVPAYVVNLAKRVLDDEELETLLKPQKPEASETELQSQDEDKNELEKKDGQVSDETIQEKLKRKAEENKALTPKEASILDIKKYVDRGKTVPKYVLLIAKSVLSDKEIDDLVNAKRNEGKKEDEEIEKIVEAPEIVKVIAPVKPGPTPPVGPTDDSNKKDVKVIKNNIAKKKKKKPGWFSKFKLKTVERIKKLKNVKAKFSLKVNVGSKEDSFLGIKGLGVKGNLSITNKLDEEKDKTDDDKTDENKEAENLVDKKLAGNKKTDENKSEDQKKNEEKKKEEEEEKKGPTPKPSPAPKEKIDSNTDTKSDADTKEDTKKDEPVGADIMYMIGKSIGGSKPTDKIGIESDKDYDSLLEAMKNYELKLEGLILPNDMESKEGKATLLTQFGQVMEIYNKINESNIAYATSSASYRVLLMGRMNPKRGFLKRMFYTKSDRNKDETSLKWVENRMTFVDEHVRKTKKEQENCKDFINEVVFKPKKVVDQIKDEEGNVDREELAKVKRETLTDDDIGKKVGSGTYNLVLKRKGEDSVVRVNLDKDRKKESEKEKKRDVAVSRLAILLGMDSIPKAKLITLKRKDKEATTEEEMELVDGKAGDELFGQRATKENKALVEKHEGELIKQLSNLQLFDILTNQTDRHRNNVMMSFEGGALTVKGIDNDQSFVANDEKDGDISSGRGRLPDISQYVDAKFANKIAGLEPSVFKNVMGDLLSDQEIKDFNKRLKDVKAYLGGSQVKMVYDWSEKINKDSEKNYFDAYKEEKDNYLDYFKNNKTNTGKKKEAEEEKKEKP